MTSYIVLEVPGAVHLLPWTVITLGDGCVVELLRRNSLQRLSITYKEKHGMCQPGRQAEQTVPHSHIYLPMNRTDWGREESGER